MSSCVQPEMAGPPEDQESRKTRVCFIGNSIMYFNDCPRLLEAVSSASIEQDSCFRGGTSFKSLFEKGNGMRDKFNTSNAQRPDGSYDIGAPSVKALLEDPKGWDYVVMIDYTQAPAREHSREESRRCLLEKHAPLLLASGAKPVLLASHAYRAHAKGSDDLGDHEEFTKRLVDGYEIYRKTLADVMPESQQPLVAPLGLAFSRVHDEKPQLWHDLFHTDGFHFSPAGTYLEACVIHCTVMGRPPPTSSSVPSDPSSLFERARRMQPPEHEPLRKPSVEELGYLRKVAMRVCSTNDVLATSGGQKRSAAAASL